MKKLLVALLVILFTLLMSSCGANEKTQSGKETEADTNEKTTEQNKGVDKFSGGYEWPDVEYIPEFKKGKIINVSKDDDGGVMIVFENVDQEDYEEYQEILKQEFPEETNDIQIDEYLLYEGNNSERYKVVSQYFREDNSFTIIGKKI